MFLNEYAGILNGPPGLASSIPGPTDTEQKIYDLYAAIENRAPSQAEMTQWTNVFQDGLTNEYIDFIKNSLKDEMTQVRYQLNNLYRQNLGREPSEDEIQYWNVIWHNEFFNKFNDFKQYLIVQLQNLANTPEEAQKKAARAAAAREQATIEAQYATAGLVTNPTADQQAAAAAAVAYEQTAIAAEKEAVTAVQVSQQTAADAAAAAARAAADAMQKQEKADQATNDAALAEKIAKDAARAAQADQESIEKQIAAEKAYFALVNARRLKQQKQADADAAAAAAATAEKKAVDVVTTGTTGNLKPLLLIAGVAFLLGKL